MERTICQNCGKIYNLVEEMVGQCNDCDPFCDEEEMLEVFGEPEYVDIQDIQLNQPMKGGVSR